MLETRIELKERVLQATFAIITGMTIVVVVASFIAINFQSLSSVSCTQ